MLFLFCRPTDQPTDRQTLFFAVLPVYEEVNLVLPNLKNFELFTRKYLCWSLISIKNFSATIIKKRLKHRCYLVNIAEFLRSRILRNICERLVNLAFAQPILVSERKYKTNIKKSVFKSALSSRREYCRYH